MVHSNTFNQKTSLQLPDYRSLHLYRKIAYLLCRVFQIDPGKDQFVAIYGQVGHYDNLEAIIYWLSLQYPKLTSDSFNSMQQEIYSDFISYTPES